MATVGASYLTFTDLLGRMNPDGSMATIIEAADNENEFIRSALLLEGNDITGHTSVQRTGLPTGTRRTLYGGVPSERSRTEKVRDAVSTLASYSKIDAEEVDMAPNPMQSEPTRMLRSSAASHSRRRRISSTEIRTPTR